MQKCYFAFVKRIFVCHCWVDEALSLLQGCGVPSAFADPSSFGDGANDTASEGGSGGDAPGDRLGELPRRTLTLRPSGMRVCFHYQPSLSVLFGGCERCVRAVCHQVSHLCWVVS